MFNTCVARYTLTVDTGDGQRWTIDPTDKGNVARWINHSSASANIVHRLIDHPSDPSHPPLIGLFSGDSGVPGGVELRWDYYNRNPQRATPFMPFVGKVAPLAGSERWELARDPVTGRHHIARWTTWDVFKVYERQGDERSSLYLDDVEDWDRLSDHDNTDEDSDDDSGPRPGELSAEESAELFAEERAADRLITSGGRWEIPRYFWQHDLPGSMRAFHSANLVRCRYWEPVPLVGFPTE